MASEVGICNRALQRLGAGRIAALDEGSITANECQVAYESIRDATLRLHPWSFAIARDQLAASATAPAFDFANQFPFPTDALRILRPIDSDCDWTIEGRLILTDWAAPLQIRYIKQITDPNTMDPLFREALSCTLAYELCEVLTQSNTKKAGLWQDFKDIISRAKAANAIERGAQDIRETDWITARL
jgi:hypothetical protein